MHKRLEDYLDQLRNQLSDLPAQQRDTEIREIRSHLEKLVADHQREGLSEDAALDKAFHQFGPSRANGRALRKAWNRAPSTGSLFRTAVTTLWGVTTGLLLLFFFANGPASPLPAAAHLSDGYTVANQVYVRELQSAAERLNANDLASPKIKPSKGTAIEVASTAGMKRFQSRMNVASTRRANDFQAVSRRILIANSFSFVLSALVVSMIFLASLRALNGRQFNRPLLS